MMQFSPVNFWYAKPPSKIRKGMDRNNLVGGVTLRIEDAKNTIQIEDRREASGDVKYDQSQVINKKETDSKRVIALD